VVKGGELDGFLDVLDDLADSGQLFGLVVVDVDGEFFFNGHDNLDVIEAVGPEVVERGFGSDVARLAGKDIDKDCAEFGVNFGGGEFHGWRMVSSLADLQSVFPVAGSVFSPTFSCREQIAHASVFIVW
jgi:hypothetical protein